MKAIILAGGKGKRLRPITDYVPKSLVPLDNIPIIEWQIQYLKKFGVTECIICTGYLTDQIENYLKIKNDFGIKIQMSKEKKPLGTGGAIKKASKKIKDCTFIVMNGDVITNIDINLLKKKENSIAAIPLKTQYGVMTISEDRVTGFSEKKDLPDLWMNAGIYFLTKDFANDLPTIGDIEKTTFPKYAKTQKLFHVKFKNASWYSIDSHKDIVECSHFIKEKKYIKFVTKRLR